MPNVTQAEAIGASVGLAVIGYELSKYWNKKAELPYFRPYDYECYQQIVLAYKDSLKSDLIPEQWETETKTYTFLGLKTHPTQELKDIDQMIQDNSRHENKLKNMNIFGKFKAGILSDILSIFYHYKHNKERTIRSYRERNDGPQMMMWSEFINWLLNVDLTTDLNADSTNELKKRIDYFTSLQRTKFSDQAKENHNTTIRTINLVLSRLESILSYIEHVHGEKTIPKLIEDIKFRTQSLIDTVFSIAYYSTRDSKIGFNAETYAKDDRKAIKRHQSHRLGCLLKIVLEKLDTKIEHDPNFFLTPKIQDQIRDIFKKEPKAKELIDLNNINDLGIPDYIKKEVQNSLFDELKNLLKLAVDLSIHRFTLSYTFEVVSDFGELWFKENDASSRALNEVLFIADKTYNKLMDQTHIFVEKVNKYLIENRIRLDDDSIKPFFHGYNAFKEFRTNYQNSVTVAKSEIQNKHSDLDTRKKVLEHRKTMLLEFFRMIKYSIQHHHNFYNNDEYQSRIDYFNNAINNVTYLSEAIHTPLSLQIQNEEQSSVITQIKTGAVCTHMTNLAKILSIYSNNISESLADTTIPQNIKNQKYCPLDSNELQPGALKDINDKFLYPYRRAAQNVNWFFSFFEGQGWWTHGEFLILYQKLTISIRYLISRMAEINPERLVIEKFIRDNFLKAVKLKKIMNQPPEITQPRELESIDYDAGVLRVTDGGDSLFIDTAMGHEEEFGLIKKRTMYEQRELIEKQKNDSRAMKNELDQKAEENVRLLDRVQELESTLNDLNPINNASFTTQVH